MTVNQKKLEQQDYDNHHHHQHKKRPLDDQMHEYMTFEDDEQQPASSLLLGGQHAFDLSQEQPFAKRSRMDDTGVNHHSNNNAEHDLLSSIPEASVPQTDMNSILGALGGPSVADGEDVINEGMNDHSASLMMEQSFQQHLNHQLMGLNPADQHHHQHSNQNPFFE